MSQESEWMEIGGGLNETKEETKRKNREKYNVYIIMCTTHNTPHFFLLLKNITGNLRLF